jgi:hypothetical protein
MGRLIPLFSTLMVDATMLLWLLDNHSSRISAKGSILLVGLET